MARFILENQESMFGLDEEAMDSTIESFKQMATSTVFGVLANLIELELLHVSEGGYAL